MKMLAGDYLCYATLAIERGGDPQCRLCSSTTGCPAPSEDIIHILTRCRGTEETRGRLIPELLKTVSKFFPSNAILSQHDHQALTQFILDCSSPNLPTSTRIDPNHPKINEVIRTCRDICHAMHTDRIRRLKALGLLNL